MTRYLLAAEADKIQDLLFRSAKLREVAGGSQLLTRFCRETPSLLSQSLGNERKDDVIISDGGSFRILFDTEEEAKIFGERLAEVYRRATGGSLTVADPVPVNGDFGKASENAHDDLRRAKRQPEDVWHGQEHLPYIAFCASCGVGLAVSHQAYHEGEIAQYLCASCLNKGAERRSHRNPKLPAKERMGEFLAGFYQVVAEQSGVSLDGVHWPGEKENLRIGEVDPIEDVAEYDPRHYVAYIVADGNNMGQVFSACKTPQQMKALSQGLTEAVHQALAEPTQMLMEQERPKDLPEDFIPVYPLILGGDDVFVLLPAPWALDFARRFAQAYEREMAQVVSGLGVPTPTISVAMVICKNKHPYALAHEAGERRLKEAKRMGKRLALDGSQMASTINFEVVLGGQLVETSEPRSIRPTLRPYWATDADEFGERGLPVLTLIKQREKLNSVPRKRLVELRDLYDDSPKSLNGDDFEAWQARLERLLERIGRDKDHSKVIEAALINLGGSERMYWRKVNCYPEKRWYGHGLPDLLEAWDFALNLENTRRDYEEA